MASRLYLLTATLHVFALCAGVACFHVHFVHPYVARMHVDRLLSNMCVAQAYYSR